MPAVCDACFLGDYPVHPLLTRSIKFEMKSQPPKYGRAAYSVTFRKGGRRITLRPPFCVYARAAGKAVADAASQSSPAFRPALFRMTGRLC